MSLAMPEIILSTKHYNAHCALNALSIFYTFKFPIIVYIFI